MRTTSTLAGCALVLGWASLANAQPITDDLIQAALEEGTVNWYTATSIDTAQAMIKGFEEKYPGIKVVLERNGGERLFQRIGQEYSAGIHNVDVVNSSELSHGIYWKQQGWLAKWVPEDVEKHWPADMRDPDNMYSIRTVVIQPFAYNTNLVSDEEAPKSWAELLDEKWKGKIVKAHPAFSGSTMASTFLVSQEFGWEYYTALAKQDILQMQGAGDPPRKAAIGERAIAIDASESVSLNEIRDGSPLKLVYPSDGVPLSETPAAVMENAPHPNAARLFHSYMFTKEAQQIGADIGFNRGLHPEIDFPDVTPLSSMKVLRASPDVDFIKAGEDVRTNYEEYFTKHIGK